MTLRARRLTVATGALICALLVFSLIAIWPSTAPAVPAVSWTPTFVAQSLAPGTRQSTVVSFTASNKIGPAFVSVVPALQPFVTVSPSSFPEISKGQTVALHVTFAVPATSSPMTVQGTLQLRNSSASNSATFSQPLPVTMNVAWSTFQDSQLGVQFQYPTFGLPGEADVKTGGNGSIIVDVKIQSTVGSVPVSQFGVLVATNQNRLSLADWFRANIDPDQLLLSTGAFASQTLANGSNALVHVGAIPAAYTRGPVAQAYVLSQSGNTVLSITQSQVNELAALGVPHDAQVGWLLEVLSTVSAP